MNLRPNADWPLGLFVILISAPIFGALAYVWWSSLSNPFVLRSLIVKAVIFLVVVGFSALWNVVHRKGPKDNPDDQISGQYSDLDE